MSKLQVCVECQRHIRESETACPFCGVPSRSASKSPGRAVILAGALAGATAFACKDKPKTEEPPPREDVVREAPKDVVREAPRDDLPKMPYGAPPPPPIADAAPADTVPSDAAPTDAAVSKKSKKRKKKDEPIRKKVLDRPPPKMPYGAPPQRRRLV